MRLTRSSSLQTPGAKTSGCATIRSLTPQVRKDPPASCPVRGSKRTRKSTSSPLSPSHGSVATDDQCKSKSIHRDVHTSSQSTPIIGTPITREIGARKSRQNGRLNSRLVSLPAILKDSSVSVNSTRGNSKSTANTSTNDTNGRTNSIDSSFTSGNIIPSRGKKASAKQTSISKDDTSNDDDSQLFDVEDILDVKLEKGRYYYLIKWKGYSHSDNTWEPEEHVPPDLLDFYFENNQAQSRERNGDSQTHRDDVIRESNCNGENTHASSHSRTRIQSHEPRYKSASRSCSSSSYSSSLDNIPAGETADQLRINCSPEPIGYKDDPYRARQFTETDDCLNYSSFQANSPPESNASVTTDSSNYSSCVQNEHSSHQLGNDLDPLSLRNLKLFIYEKPSSSSSSSSKSISHMQCTSFELNDSLVPGKIVSIDESPFGTGKVALIKWLNNQPPAWLDYDFVKLKYPDLLAEFCEALHMIDSPLPTF